jgi:hypothetical protein
MCGWLCRDAETFSCSSAIEKPTSPFFSTERFRIAL